MSGDPSRAIRAGFHASPRFVPDESGVYTECLTEPVETQLSLSGASRSCITHIFCKRLFQTSSKSLIPLIF
jgi:hypothetical protein